MAHKVCRLFCGFVMFGMVASGALSASGQASKPADRGGSSITGCVQKGDEPNGFTLTTQDGTVYELVNNPVNLGEHVGHTVTVTGKKVRESKAKEERREASEQREAGGGKHADFKIEFLQMVSESCNK